jgi:hypothetical protein
MLLEVFLVALNVALNIESSGVSKATLSGEDRRGA